MNTIGSKEDSLEFRIVMLENRNFPKKSGGRNDLELISFEARIGSAKKCRTLITSPSFIEEEIDLNPALTSGIVTFEQSIRTTLDHSTTSSRYP